MTYKGRILGERYGDDVDLHTPPESWSMTKSLTGTLVGVLIQQGTYDLWQPAPIPEWQTPGDPRQEIRIGDIMRMSSGLRINAPSDPDYDGEDYHSFPQRALFDRIGIRDAIIETDPYGNFLGQGLAFMSARDWARLGNLYLQDGVWDGERSSPRATWRTPPPWRRRGRPMDGSSTEAPSFG